MDRLISVIIPVFNTAKYLVSCIDSILAQSYQNFELILVDDGSTDKSGKICDNFANHDNRIKVLHRQNGGVCAARNAALDIAKGEFITFVDSDDTLSPSALEILLSKQIETDADLVGAALATFKGGKTFTAQSFSGVFSGGEIAENLFEIYSASPISCCKLFKSSIIGGNNIRFMNGVAFAEDTYFLMQYIEFSQKLVFIPDVIYYYNRANYSSATSKFHFHCDRYNIYNFEKIKEIIERSDMSVDEKKQALSKFADRMCCEIINHYMINLPVSNLLFNKVSRTAEYYNYYLAWDFAEKSSMKISPEALGALKSGHTEEFIRLWKHDNRKACIKRSIKNKLIKIKII